MTLLLHANQKMFRVYGIARTVLWLSIENRKNSRCFYEDFPEVTIRVPVPSLGMEHIITNALKSQDVVSPVSVSKWLS